MGKGFFGCPSKHTVWRLHVLFFRLPRSSFIRFFICHGVTGRVFASGLAASMAIANMLKVGDHVLCSDDVYGGDVICCCYCLVLI